MTTDTQEQTEVSSEATPQAPDAPASESQELPADVASFLESRTKGQELPAAEGEPAAESPSPATEELDPFLKARLDELTEVTKEDVSRQERERLQREAQDREAQLAAQQARKEFLDGYANDVRQAMQSVYQRVINAGGTEEEAQEAAGEVKTYLNARHDKGLQLYEPTALAQARQQSDQEVAQALARALGPLAQPIFAKAQTVENYAWEDVVRDVVTEARKGYVSEAQAKKDALLSLIAYRRTLEEAGLIQGASSGQDISGGGSIGGLPSRAQWAAATYDQRLAWKKQHGEDVTDRITS